MYAIAVGDQYVDNDWTPMFKATRALLRARLHRIKPLEWPEPTDPLPDADRDGIVKIFLREYIFTDVDVAERIALHALEYSCDYTPDGDPFRWSPIVAECSLLDWAPRKAFLDIGEVRAMEDVLTSWVAFAGKMRGIEERFVAETQMAIARLIPEFQRLATDQDNFGQAKSIANAMMASGIDLSDQEAVNAWIAEFNERPYEQRIEILGPPPDLD